MCELKVIKGTLKCFYEKAEKGQIRRYTVIVIDNSLFEDNSDIFEDEKDMLELYKQCDSWIINKDCFKDFSFVVPIEVASQIESIEYKQAEGG